MFCLILLLCKTWCNITSKTYGPVSEYTLASKMVYTSIGSLSPLPQKSFSPMNGKEGTTGKADFFFGRCMHLSTILFYRLFRSQLIRSTSTIDSGISRLIFLMEYVNLITSFVSVSDIYTRIKLAICILRTGFLTIGWSVVLLNRDQEN